MKEDDSLKVKNIIICVALILVLAVCEAAGIVGYKLYRERSEQQAMEAAEPKTPFSGLSAEDISGAVANTALTSKEHTLSEAELTQLAAMLREIVIYEEHEPESLIGGSNTVTVSLKGGKSVTVSLCGEMYIRIDGVCYKSWEEPAEKLDRFIFNIAYGGGNYE